MSILALLDRPTDDELRQHGALLGRALAAGLRTGDLSEDDAESMLLMTFRLAAFVDQPVVLTPVEPQLSADDLDLLENVFLESGHLLDRIHPVEFPAAEREHAKAENQRLYGALLALLAPDREVPLPTEDTLPLALTEEDLAVLHDVFNLGVASLLDCRTEDTEELSPAEIVHTVQVCYNRVRYIAGLPPDPLLFTAFYGGDASALEYIAEQRARVQQLDKPTTPDCRYPACDCGDLTCED